MSKAVTIKLPPTTTEVTIHEEWIEARDKVVRDAQAVTAVTGQADYDTGSDTLRQITRMSNRLEELRKDFSKPFLQAQKAIKAAADEARQPLEEEKKRVSDLLSQYKAEERRRRAEEERKAEEERQAKLREQAEQAEAARELLGEDAEPETEPEPEPAVLVPRETRSDSSRTVERLVFRVEDEEQVPRPFLSVDERKIRAWRDENKERIQKALADGQQPVPGVVFEIETKVTSR